MLPLLLIALAQAAVDQPKPIESLPHPKEATQPVYLMTIATSPVDATLAVALADGSVWMVDAAKLSVGQRIRCASAAPCIICFAPDGKTIATGAYSPGFDKVIWTVAKTDGSGSTISTKVEGSRINESAQFSPDGARLLLHQADGGMILWDYARELSTKLSPPTEHRLATACWWGNDKLISGDSKGVVRVWNADGTLIKSMPALTSRVDCVDISPDGTRLLTTFGPKARLWRLPDMTLDVEFSSTQTLFIPDNDGLFGASWSRNRLLLAGGTQFSIECRAFDGSLAWADEFACGDEKWLICSFDPSGTFASCARNGGNQGRVYEAETGIRRMDGVLATESWDVIEWTGDAQCVALLSRSKRSVTIADTKSFARRGTITSDAHGELTVSKQD
ncbi:MAG: WD40 repeat domain-containing protein [Planctomycetes bacterium]|nr:WD40 repeat domain-containing protein [Planctomycetota bacterium]